MNKKVRIVILAAGKGTRMKSELPKALVPLKGKPMIRHELSAILQSGVDERPLIVVGYKKEEIIKEIGDAFDYAIQTEQLGTGHAIMSAEYKLKGAADSIIVLPCDHPFISADTIKKLSRKHEESGATITMATVSLPDYEDWRKVFYTSFSRIIRDETGKIIKDVQFRDATDAEKKITEVNPIFFCFKSNWLWENLKNLNTDNDQKQYYQTDLIKMAIDQGKNIESIAIEPREALAANSREELEILENLMIK